MRLALDTKRYSDLCRGNVPVVETVELAEEVWLCYLAPLSAEARRRFAVRP